MTSRRRHTRGSPGRDQDCVQGHAVAGQGFGAVGLSAQKSSVRLPASGRLMLGPSGQPDECRGQVNEGEKASGELVVPRCCAPELLQPGEEALDEVAVLVLSPVDRPGVLSIGKGRNDRLSPERFDVLYDGCRVVGFVSGDTRDLLVRGFRQCPRLIEESICLYAVVDVTSSQGDNSQVAETLYGGVDLCCKTTSRAPQCLLPVFF